MRKSLIDTDILSEIRKGKNYKINVESITYRAIWQQHTISVITVSEIIKGWRRINRNDRIQEFLTDLSQLEILSLDQSCAEISGLIQADLETSGQPIGLADVLIASIAIANNLVLVTGNTKHYQKIQVLGYPLVIDNWRE
ncbi:PIN domain-containing protein [Nodularia sp. UHCC 0506]|uniref:PIN domain-containing protein n=1 Tax=Nodularia sp. UHCC 0506 TaxID=3110243 RepID=UPI002B2090BC|nr:PIN domain-containing protein [Nodularia sp. UHCC 0506]MEA5512826.1 PIN domain-containing protein [Nodularia sp. UHCC 0506]